ncbi:MAG: ArsR family transcriptional regulator [Planctomycetota bacterium]
MHELEVTATAVRQRVERLLERGLIERQKHSAGRGRPTFRYLLTSQGYRHVGADATDLAEAMWVEIVSLPESEVRDRLIGRVAQRLGRQFAGHLAGRAETDPEHHDVAKRMRQLTSVLQQHEIPAAMDNESGLPVLDIGSCPYPSLTDTSDDRSMCRLEEQMLSEALGQPVHLSSCRLDGDHCCQFTTQDAGSDEVSVLHICL